MYEDTDVNKLRKNLNDRLQSLRDLYSGDLISKNTLSGQLLELVATREARMLWDIIVKKDITARRMLMMLEDPQQWEDDSSTPQEERQQVLKERLADAFFTSGDSNRDVLEVLLDIASLPHFESFAFTRNDKSKGKKSGAKLSVLD